MHPTTQHIYDYIREQWDVHQQVPTLREIAEACAIAKSTVIYHLDKLEAQGYLQREPYQTRGIRLTDRQAADDLDTETVYTYLRITMQQGVAPTQEEIATACYLSRAVVRRCLEQLEVEGVIEIGEGQRSLRWLEKTNGRK